jgi:predicted ATPase/transcriptional regulator with XRE-family HTH domain
MDSDASFGYWLTRRRKALRMSRAELARRVCCAAITLRKIEEDARRPSRQIAAKLADHLAVPGGESATFIRVARGELQIEWLPPAEWPATDTPHPATGARLSNLSIPPTPLIGRAADVAAVCDLLRRNPDEWQGSDTRLLTLTGAPGIGKTRLGLQVATQLRDAFADGVWLISLAPLRDPSLVLATITQTLGIAERTGVSLLDRLTAYLRDRQMLLILDNFEHVLPAAPQLAVLLAAAPQLQLLVTSRVALRLAGEQRYAVPALALPPTTDDRRPTTDDAPDGVVGRRWSVVDRYAAVELFIQRARTIHPHFALTEKNAPAVAAICARLDGLPLAIELAATRVNLFTPQELLTRLGRRFALLTTGALDLPPRQQTLRRAIDWSYALLDEAERTLFRQLGVFIGGCTLTAAAAVLNVEFTVLSSKADNSALKTMPSSAAKGLNSELGILDALAALVDQSLVRRDEGSHGRSRFTMLETIREYALERLAQAGELEATQQRHLAYYLVLAEQAGTRLAASDQLLWLDRLEQDHDNLRAALAWAIDHQPEVALQLAGAMTEFWDTRCYHSEGRRWLDQVLDLRSAMLGSELPNDAQAKAHNRTSNIVRALHGAGRLAHAQEDNLRAQMLFTEGLALARALNDSRRIALLLNDLSELALHQGDTEHAMNLYTEGLALAYAADDRSVIARLLLGLGDLALTRGDQRDAAAYYAESLALRRAINDRRGIAWALHALGNLALVEQAWQRAAELFAEGLALAREVGDRENTAWLLYHTGLMALEQHDLAGATARFVESARLLHVLGAGQGVALNLVGLATMMIQHEDLAQAARLLSVAEAQHWVASGSWWVAADQATYDRAVATVQARIDAATFATVWAEARTITLEQALTAALDY